MFVLVLRATTSMCGWGKDRYADVDCEVGMRSELGVKEGFSTPRML